MFGRRAARTSWFGLLAMTVVLLSHPRTVVAAPLEGTTPPDDTPAAAPHPGPAPDYTVASTQPPAPEYTVASGRVPAPSGGQGTRRPLDPLDSVPEKLALLMVGGLLLGLAAAVRRTT